MQNNVLETRTMINGMYQLTLQISDNEYFLVYDSLNEEDAAELLTNYLSYRADDGKPDNVSLKHNKNEHIVTIKADLLYTDNEKTEKMYQMTGHLQHRLED